MNEPLIDLINQAEELVKEYKVPIQYVKYCISSAELLPKLVKVLTGDNSYAQGFRDGEQAAIRKYEAEKERRQRENPIYAQCSRVKVT